MENNKKLSVSVGIAAYNEEKNIANILRGVLSQKRKNWILKEILVYSDGSEDKTVKEAKKQQNKLIKVKDNLNRKGKVFRIEELCKNFRGDILVFFDADVKLANDQIVNQLVETFNQDEQIMLVGGNTRPFPPKTFFEKAVYSTFRVFDKSREYKNNGNNIFGATGGCLAVRKKLAKIIKFPNVLNDDDYLYFFCISKGYKFKYVKNAVVNYKLPKNTFDYIRQTLRSDPKAIEINYSKYFGDLVKKEYSRENYKYLNSILDEFISNPFGVIYISIINAACKLFITLVLKRHKLAWYTATSTK